MPLAILREHMRQRLQLLAKRDRAAPGPGQPVPGLARMLGEMAFMFAALLAVDHWVAPGTFLTGISPSPLWLPVLAMAVGYGGGMGLLAAGVASVIWATAPHPALAGGDHLARVLRLSIEPMEWIVVALVIGELTAHRLERLRRLRRRCDRREQELAQLATTVEQIGRINRSLQVRIATEERTVGQAIAAALDLVDDDAAAQAGGIERLVGMAAQTDDFAFYACEGNRFVARFVGPEAGARPKRMSWNELAAHVATNTPSDGSVAFPVFGAGEAVTGVLLIKAPTEAHLPVAKQAELTDVACSLDRIARRAQPGKPARRPAEWTIREDAV